MLEGLLVHIYHGNDPSLRPCRNYRLHQWAEIVHIYHGDDLSLRSHRSYRLDQCAEFH